MMTLKDFQEYIELYSGDLSRWPQHLIREAAQLAEKDAGAKALLDAHVNFDAVMRQYDAPVPKLQALEDRIMQQIANTPQGTAVPNAAVAAKQSRGWRNAWFFAPGGGLLAAALMGFIIGFHPQPKTVLLDPSYYSESQVLASNDAATDTGDIINDTDDSEIF